MRTREAWLGVSVLLGGMAAAGCAGTTETVPNDGGGGGSTVVLDGGGPIPAPPEGEAACPQGKACNYQSSAGCGAAESCVPVSDGQGNIAPFCQPAGQGQSGASCGSNAECAPRFLCANGTCRRLCCGGDWSACPKGEHCFREILAKDASGNVVDTGAMLCLPSDDCDALSPASCVAPGTQCLIVDGTGATACIQPGAGQAGEACPCAGGHVCVEDEGKEICRRLCKAVEGGGEPGCEGGDLCIHFNRDPAGVGECTPKGG